VARIYTSADELIGKTPLIELKNTEKKYGLQSRLVAKLEYFNPAGSVKDRVAKEILDSAEREGLISPTTVIIEPTSGNTGIGLAAVGAARGYKTVIVMPSTMSDERKKIIKAYGARLVLTDGALGMSGAIEEAERIHRENPNSIIAGQFTNYQNVLAHYKTTGPEIYEDTDGEVDIFVAGVGTGGTITGVSKFLKEKNPAVKVVAVEPLSSPVLSSGKTGAHGIQGIGAGFVPDILDTSAFDEVIAVSEEDAYSASRELGVLEGVLVGISSGAALHAAKLVAARSENSGKTVVVLLPDSAERYLSTELFES